MHTDCKGRKRTSPVMIIYVEKPKLPKTKKKIKPFNKWAQQGRRIEINTQQPMSFLYTVLVINMWTMKFKILLSSPSKKEVLKYKFKTRHIGLVHWKLQTLVTYQRSRDTQTIFID